MIPTENAKICDACSSPTSPFATSGLCRRCEQREEDRMGGIKVVVWTLAWWIIGLAFILSACTASGASVVTDALLDQVAWRESRNNPRAVGKAGEVGAYQIRSIAVREVNRVFGTSYRHSDAILHGRQIARLYLIICERRTVNPTPERVYRKYRGLR